MDFISVHIIISWYKRIRMWRIMCPHFASVWTGKCMVYCWCHSYICTLLLWS